jgi:acetylornithine/succinyldiaminopimelate/putrescine aminotransferase
MTTENYIRLEDEYGARNYKPLDVVLTRGKGVWVWDVEGEKYLDCLAAYSALSQGHCHLTILKTLVEQAERLTLVSRAFRNDQWGPFYKEVCELTDFHMGSYFMKTLSDIPSRYIREIRGMGLMIGVELHPMAGGARRFCEKLKDRGILCKDTHQNVIRFTPPLIIRKEEIDWALERIEDALTQVS